MKITLVKDTTSEPKNGKKLNMNIPKISMRDTALKPFQCGLCLTNMLKIIKFIYLVVNNRKSEYLILKITKLNFVKKRILLANLKQYRWEALVRFINNTQSTKSSNAMATWKK